MSVKLSSAAAPTLRHHDVYSGVNNDNRSDVSEAEDEFYSDAASETGDVTESPGAVVRSLHDSLKKYPLNKHLAPLVNVFCKKYWWAPSTKDGHYLIDATFLRNELMPALKAFMEKRGEQTVNQDEFETQDKWFLKISHLYRKLRRKNAELATTKTPVVELEGSEISEFVLFSKKIQEVILQGQKQEKESSTISDESTQLVLGNETTTDLAQLEESDRSLAKITDTAKSSLRSLRYFTDYFLPTVRATTSSILSSAKNASSYLSASAAHVVKHGTHFSDTLLIAKTLSISPSDWDSFNHSLLNLLDTAENTSADEDEYRKAALDFINAGKRVKLFFDKPNGKIGINKTSIHSWINTQHKFHETLGVSKHTEVQVTEWDGIFQDAGKFARTILDSAELPQEKEMDERIHQLKMELELASDSSSQSGDSKTLGCNELANTFIDSLRKEHYVYLQAIRFKMGSKEAPGGEHPLSFLYRTALFQTEDIVENKFDRENLKKAAEAVLENPDTLPLHHDVQMQLEYFCTELKKLAETTSTDQPPPQKRDNIRKLLWSFEAFMNGHFSLYREDQIDPESIQDHYSKWSNLWRTAISQTSLSGDDSLGVFARWGARDREVWPSDLSRKIYRVETHIEYSQHVQLYRKIKIFLILQIIDYLFKTHLCKDAQGGYSDAYRDLITDWQPDRETSFYDNFLAKLRQDGRQLNIFQITVAKLVYKLIEPLLDRVVMGVVDNAQVKAVAFASHFETSKKDNNSSNTRFFRAVAIDNRDKFFKSIAASLQNIITVDDEYHHDKNSSEKSGSAFDQIKKKLREPRFHNNLKQADLYRKMDRKIVHQLSYKPDWVDNASKHYNDKIKKTANKAAKVFYHLIRLISMTALYIPEKLTGYILREIVFYFFHRSPVSSNGLVGMLQMEFTSEKTTSHVMNNLVCNLLDKLDETLTNSLSAIERVTNHGEGASRSTTHQASEKEDDESEPIQVSESQETVLYSKEQLTNRKKALTGPEKRNCNNAIQNLLYVIRRYKDSFNDPRHVDPVSTDEKSMEGKLKEIALSLGDKLTEALDSILTSEFLKAQFLDLQSKLNDTLEGKPGINIKSSVELREKIDAVASKAIELGVKTKYENSKSLNRAHILSYGYALHELQEELIKRKIAHFSTEKSSLEDAEISEVEEGLSNVKARITNLLLLKQGIDDFKTKTRDLIDNAKLTKIPGVDERGEYRLDEQLLKRKKEIDKAIVKNLESDIKDGLGACQSQIVEIEDKDIKPHRDIQQASEVDFMTGKFLIRTMRTQDRRKYYFTRHLSLIIERFLPKNDAPMDTQQFYNLCDALYRAGFFPQKPQFELANKKIKPPLFTLPAIQKHGFGRKDEKEELEKMLGELSQGLYDSLKKVFDKMPKTSFIAKFFGNKPKKQFDTASWSLFKKVMTAQHKKITTKLSEHEQAFIDRMIGEGGAITAHRKKLQEAEDNICIWGAREYKKANEAIGPFTFTRSYAATDTIKSVFEGTVANTVLAKPTIRIYQDAVKDKIDAFRDFIVDRDSFSEYLAQSLIITPFIQKTKK